MSNALNFNPFKKHLLVMFTMVLSIPFSVQSQDREEEEQNLPQQPQTVQPSKGIVIAVLSTMFAITTILLLYVKFCRVNNRHQLLTPNSNLQNFQGRSRSSSRLSGIDREVVKTLPFFTFSSLKGFKDGLECTVCLSRFEDAETLRLLPKCMHAFHMNCIDKWFESHSTCPLCRRRVEAGDIKNLNYSLSSRFLRVPSNLTEDLNLEIFVQREASHRGSSTRGFKDAGKCKKQELLLGDGSGTKWDKHVRVTNLKIVISDVFTRSRWSDLNSSDLLSLNSEMLNDVSSRRFCSSSLESTADSGKVQGSWRCKEEEKWFTEVNPGEKRCMSEIANVPRFAEMGKENRIGESVRSNERLGRVWLPIARRTIQWIAKQERNPSELEPKTLASNV
ncbi:putative RING-H2 finger protein ATL12 [Vigna unguiculata]|uniref:RING-type E3 ubiquitin transferase n=1 Tax=Vigna unguiculata TaxID=3917 RepID=A0A4D6NQA1_VIGUN|nr:putative RING-H2 finger protein ATL12 [Vigna unguiculata]QCE16070.1 E3 ubiquitin-protein ligase [Vigna unguiculata]